MLIHATIHGVLGGCAVRAEPIAIADGDVLDVPGAPRVVHTPGHTPGHVSLWFPDRQTLIAGDALTTMNVAGPDPRGPMILPNTVTSDPQAAMRSIDKFRDLGNLTLLSGHGPAWKGTGEKAVAGALNAGD